MLHDIVCVDGQGGVQEQNDIPGWIRFRSRSEDPHGALMKFVRRVPLRVRLQDAHDQGRSSSADACGARKVMAFAWSCAAISSRWRSID